MQLKFFGDAFGFLGEDFLGFLFPSVGRGFEEGLDGFFLRLEGSVGLAGDGVFLFAEFLGEKGFEFEALLLEDFEIP